MAKTHGTSKENCNHNCNETKHTLIQSSITSTSMGYSERTLSNILDFYIAHAMCKTCANERKVTEYGWRGSTSKTEGYPALLDALLNAADIHNTEEQVNFTVIYGERMEKTLCEMGFLYQDGKKYVFSTDICTTHPRIVLLGEYNLSYDENNIEYASIVDKETEALCLFRHIRNALAHSIVYEYDDMLLLVDKNERSETITACILIKKQTLEEWIYIVDKRHRFYIQEQVQEAENRVEELVGAL